MRLISINKKQTIAIVAVIAIGILLAMLILNTEKTKATADEHAHSESEMQSDASEKPQHGEAGHDHEKDHQPAAAASSEDADHQHEAQPQEVAKGPHGGKLFTQDGYSVELTIYEQNVPPEFRIYTYKDGKPLAPVSSNVTVNLHRLGREAEVFTFQPEKDYLKGSAEVKEPHSFEAKINAKYQNKSYQFGFEQVEGRVKLSKDQVLHNNIEILTAGPAKISTTLNMQGQIKLNADTSVKVLPRVSGIVELVHVHAGDKVRKGQVLATISSQDMVELRSELQAARQKVSLAKATYEREKQLWEEKISAQQDYLQAQNDLQEAQINANRVQQKLSAIDASANGQARYEIRSPISGVVTLKQISQGQVVSAVDNVFEIADLSAVWAEMVVYAKDLNKVKVGQKVTIKAAAFEAQAEGTIQHVSALVGEQTRTAEAHVVLENQARTWVPGMPVNIALKSDEVEVPLAVSIEGLQSLRDWTVVFGRYGDYFEARPVTIGRRDDKFAEVLDGLQAGEQYAAGNSFVVKADIGKAGASHDH